MTTIWLKRKPKKEDPCTLGRSDFVLIADYEYYLVPCWTCICSAFSCASLIFPVDHPPFLPSENCSEDLSFKKLCRRGTTDPSIILHLLFSFPFIRFFLSLQFYYLLPIYFHAETFSSAQLWSEVKRVSFSKARWDSKIVESTKQLRSCFFNNSQYCCPFWSTRDNHKFWKLQLSRILSDKIRWTPRGKSIQKYTKTNYRNKPIIIKQ